MKTDYTLYIYSADKRYTKRERLCGTYEFTGVTNEGMERESRALRDLYPLFKYRMEWTPTMKTVKNLMTGKDISIPHDTPHCCDPSTEQYWSM